MMSFPNRVALFIVATFLIAAPMTAMEAHEKLDVNAPTIVDLLLVDFQKRNTKINTVMVTDIAWVASSKAAGYVVVARGFRHEQHSFEGNWEDELFGIYAVDQRLSRILQKIDMFPTERWHDFNVSISSVHWNSVVITGQGSTYGDQLFEKKYDLSKVPWPGIKAPNKPGKPKP